MTRYREIPEDRILEFPATPGFRGYKQFFTEESVTHPAKMNLNLLRWILETYTSEGDVVLDPMAGTGSTAIIAALMGRHGVAIEYEPRFCDMIRANILLTERQVTLTPKGKMICIQGDARELSKLFGRSDVIVTSPPFGPSTKGGGIFREGYKAPGEEEVSDPGLPQRHARPLSDDPRNIDNLEYGESIDAVITSPPYGNRLADDVVHDGDTARMSYRQAIDSIVTSPPYELTTSSKQHGRDPKPTLVQGGSGCEDINLGYSDDEDNIGILKGETYLEAMLKVYRESHKVLKPAAKLIVVIKNFIRDRQVVRLDQDTIKLCEASGFTLMDRWYFRLPTRSFWKILYRRKYPDVPEVEYEDVLVFTKGVDD